MSDTTSDITVGRVTKWTLYGFVTVALLLALCLGGVAGCKTFSRYQARADAKNNVSISNIEISNQEQRIQIAKQKAEIRKQDAIGVREAQDEIAKTLTPLYVQFEMVQALQAIALSGKNSTVIYIPSGNAGIPIIQNALTGADGKGQ